MDQLELQPHLADDLIGQAAAKLGLPLYLYVDIPHREVVDGTVLVGRGSKGLACFADAFPREPGVNQAMAAADMAWAIFPSNVLDSISALDDLVRRRQNLPPHQKGQMGIDHICRLMHNVDPRMLSLLRHTLDAIIREEMQRDAAAAREPDAVQWIRAPESWSEPIETIVKNKRILQELADGWNSVKVVKIGDLFQLTEEEARKRFRRERDFALHMKRLVEVGAIPEGNTWPQGRLGYASEEDGYYMAAPETEA